MKEGEKRKPLEPFRECRPESEEGEQYINSEHPATWEGVGANIDFESIDKWRRKAGHRGLEGLGGDERGVRCREPSRRSRDGVSTPN